MAGHDACGFPDQLSDGTGGRADAKAFAELAQMFKSFKWTMAYVAPRGVGPTAWDKAKRSRISFAAGSCCSGKRWKGCRSGTSAGRFKPERIAGERIATVAARPIDRPPVWRCTRHYSSRISSGWISWQLPTSHRKGPSFLNVLRHLTARLAVALATERSKVRLRTK